MTSNDSQRRVVVTGLGAVTDLGPSADALWEGLVAGRSGVTTISAFEQDDAWAVRIAGAVSGWDPIDAIGKAEYKRMDRCCGLGYSAALEAAAHSGIDFSSGDPYRRGVIIGSGVGGIRTIEDGTQKLYSAGPGRLSPFTVPKLMANACVGQVSIKLNIRGMNSCPSTACASAGHSIAEACTFIQRGTADVMIAGGTEGALTPICISSFSAMKALSTRNDDPAAASRPFDRDRDGFVLCEGAGIIVLEEYEHAKARGATIYCEVKGFGITCDAYHIAAPDPNGSGARVAMELAIADAGITKESVEHINTHGTSTPLGDAAEVAAVKEFFGDHAASIAVTSTKSMTGHALGAAGGIESIAVARAIFEGVIPPTINLDNPDEGFDLDFVAHEAREASPRIALNNSFGFGGHNVSLVFGKV